MQMSVVVIGIEQYVPEPAPPAESISAEDIEAALRRLAAMSEAQIREELRAMQPPHSGILTTESGRSSYGQPVLVYQDQPFGPGDLPDVTLSVVCSSTTPEAVEQARRAGWKVRAWEPAHSDGNATGEACWDIAAFPPDLPRVRECPVCAPFVLSAEAIV